jgi:CheY-like chemotaxis protein
MNGIIATTQLLEVTNIDVEQRKYINILKDSANTLGEAINEILDISRIELGALKLNKKSFDLKNTINNIYNNLLVVGNCKGLEIGYYLDPNIDFNVTSDEVKLKQILSNLIQNAVKFTDEGSISFRTEIIYNSECAVKIEFIIKDTGIGIEEEFKNKIFENFNQGDISENKKFQGIGLGLAISKQLALLLNGELTFESKVGIGSIFKFTCEFNKSSTNEVKKYVEKEYEEKVEINKQNKNKTILCVEDNIINQEVMESIISKAGYKVIPAYNGNEVFEILPNQKIDLVLMDIQLPTLNGYEITKIIREKYEKENHIPIIAMTAYAMREDKDSCIKAGMDDYITKPLDIEALYNILQIYLTE